MYLDTIYGQLDTRNLEKFCVRVQDDRNPLDQERSPTPLFPDRALAHDLIERRLAKNAKIHSTPSRDDSVERQVAQVVALVQQPVKAPTAPATADGAPVPADLAGAAQIQSCGSGARRSVDTAITAEKVTAAAKSSATFNAPRISRCGEDASVLRRDAEPPAERAAETRVLAKPLPGALQRCKGLSRAGNVHTCSTGKVLAVSTFQDSEFPRHKKKERSGTVQKHRVSRRHCAGKLRAGGRPDFGST